ncbi:keratin-associated protein 9-1-like [Pomacea canaliculata]|uniref:keratin-associated protein 9-1-like n=1 Tax=Pomacea canaliculata TaxID=400727 RepID=UPI000D73C167|nr:keratin-associated protein 9-1-like [Pomacea canaliculata]
MFLFFVLCSLGLVCGFDHPLCLARLRASASSGLCPGAVCRIVLDSTTGVTSAKCIKGGYHYCPEPPLEEGPLFGGQWCQRQCEEDTDCTGRQVCCNDFYGCGKKCRDPLPLYTCEHLKCTDGQMCVMAGTELPAPSCINSTCSPPCGSGLKCEMDVDPSCTQTPCPPVPRCLAKDPACSPPCAPGYSCLLTQVPGCSKPPCPKVPQCRPQCLAYPGGINESNCIVSDLCSPSPSVAQTQCPGGTVCCPTVCGRRCLQPLPV